MPWTSLVRNPEGLEAVYQGDPPDLSGVRVHEVALHEDGPTLRIRLDLPRYPDQPPRKWAVQGFNTVQVEISMGNLHAITLEGFTTSTTANVSLTAKDGVTLGLTSSGTHIKATADFVFISGLSAYVNEVGEP
ncbi:hypothetical protein JK359_04445 [Streptomyces actinomycinicus]|uniref:Immunity protein 50 n=1 Tax=Streptomyces actinomycinicus TaxID=1695166 RepID=A0A937EE16_9ACTN|nr:hypothetical protein [Streptomyces actinomycinicus]